MHLLLYYIECLAQIGQIAGEPEASSSNESKMRQMFRLKAVHLLALFILVYVGVEVTIAGKCQHVSSPFTVAHSIHHQGGLSHSKSMFVEADPPQGEKTASL
jgi:fucose permease